MDSLIIQRYCPFCRKYTAWKRFGDVELCEGGTRDEGNNHCVISKGAYIVRLPQPGNYCPSRCQVVYFRDEETECCGPTLSYGGRRMMLIHAMEAEMKAGGFDPVLWSPTFPWRTAEIVLNTKAEVVKALDRPLPPQLVGVIMGYLLW